MKDLKVILENRELISSEDIERVCATVGNVITPRGGSFTFQNLKYHVIIHVIDE